MIDYHTLTAVDADTLSGVAEVPVCADTRSVARAASSGELRRYDTGSRLENGAFLSGPRAMAMAGDGSRLSGPPHLTCTTVRRKL